MVNWQTIVQDLDRCEHGRHSHDRCFDCPEGWSSGNLHLPPGTVLGHTLGGDHIVVPSNEARLQPEAWVVPRDPLTRVSTC